MRSHPHKVRLQSQSRHLGTMLIVMGAIVSSAMAHGQGFMVKPMRMEAFPNAGQRVELPLEIRNTGGPDGPRDIVIRFVELSQTPHGSWRLVEPERSDLEPRHASCLEWLSVSEQQVNIAPLSPAEVTVSIDVPHDARGTYFAGIVAETPIDGDGPGIRVRVRFLIPVIVEIQGRPVRQQVKLQDAHMVYDAGEDGPSTTTAFLKVSNDGQTFSRVRGNLRIERQSGERWRPVTRVEIDERGIIPGVTLELGGDLGRRLPSGVYRLQGEMTVDGRRMAPILKELEFEGDPNADAAAYDTALVLNPEIIAMEITPGATRTALLTIENPGEDPVNVALATATPRPLSGVEFNGMFGVELSAEPWTEITPASFTLRGRGRQNVRVVSRAPQGEVNHAHYYADLIVQGTYNDGQSAGETRSLVHLHHNGVDSRPEGVVEHMVLAEGAAPGEYIVQVRFTNIGNVHAATTARAYMLTGQGIQVRSKALAGDEEILLPLARRSFSGEIDLNGIEPGYYALRTDVDYAGGRRASKQLVLHLEQGDDAPKVTVINPEEDAVPEGVEIPDADAVVLSEDQAVEIDLNDGRESYLIVEEVAASGQESP